MLNYLNSRPSQITLPKSFKVDLTLIAIGSPKQIASDPSYDKVLSGLKEELNAMMTEYQGTFIVG